MSNIYPVPPRYFKRANYRILTKDLSLHLCCSMWFLLLVKYFPKTARSILMSHLEKYYMVKEDEIEQIHYSPIYFSPPF